MAVMCSCRQLQEEAGPELDQRCLLVLLLVLERCRGQDSFFAPYCNILPATYGEQRKEALLLPQQGIYL
jgi:hypothetical protein